MSEQIVELNIGGTVYQTTVTTLRKFDGMFKVMMETEMPVLRDHYNQIFIDRSPRHFDMILNYMRDGHVELPECSRDLKEIQTEAHHYLLEGLVEMCMEKILEEKAASAEAETAPKKLKIIETDGELLEIITDLKKPTLVFHCPSNAFGTIQYPVGFDPIDFQKKYTDRMEIYYKPHKTDRATRGVEWNWTIYKNAYSVGNLARDPRQTFEQHLEDNIKYVLMD